MAFPVLFITQLLCLPFTPYQVYASFFFNYHHIHMLNLFSVAHLCMCLGLTAWDWIAHQEIRHCRKLRVLISAIY